MITTNSRSVEPITPAEPRKLGIRTTGQLPTPEPEQITRGSDLSKMITTHDEPDYLKDPDAWFLPKSKPILERDIEDMSQDRPKKGRPKKGK